MKCFFTSLLITGFTTAIMAQGTIHYQWHRDGVSPVYAYNGKNAIYQVLKIANNSNNNAIGVIDLENETWSYTGSPALTYSAMNNAYVYMKNTQEGFILNGPTSGNNTTNGWQTLGNTPSLPAGFTMAGTTPFGYYGYTSISGTYTAYFSANAMTWTPVHTSTNVPYFAQTNSKLFTIQNGTLKVSTNGGASYSVVNSTVTLGGMIFAPHNDTLYVTDTQLKRSFDGGVTWSSVAYPNSTFQHMACKNGKEILMVNTSMTPKTAYYSNNSGTSFTSYTTIPAAYSGEKLFASSKFFIFYPNFKTSDGNSWSNFLAMAPAPKPYDITATGNIVLAGIAQGFFGYSTNYGQTFSYPGKVNTSSTDVMAVKADNINKFYAADRKGQVSVSIDKGITWTQKNTNTNNNVPRKFTISANSNTVLLSCLGGPVMSTDGGNTFAGVNILNGGVHYQTLKPTAGTAIDVGGIFNPPTFALSGWQFYTLNPTGLGPIIGSVTCQSGEEVIDIQMRDDNVGYFMTRNSANNETIVYKTTNGWVTTNSISAIPSPTSTYKAYDGRYGNVQLFGQDTVIISGSGNVVSNQTNFYHISTDGGLSWTKVNTNFSNPTSILGNNVYKLSFINSNRYVGLTSLSISGSGQASSGVVLNTVGNSGGSSGGVGIEELSFNRPTDFIKLYPNPAHDVLRIELKDLILHQALELKVMDMMGKIIFEGTVGQEFSELDVAHLQNGIYFVSIVLEGKNYTAKFIKE